MLPALFSEKVTLEKGGATVSPNWARVGLAQRAEGSPVPGDRKWCLDCAARERGVVYYYFQESAGRPAPDPAVTEESSQPIGETLRPVWGLMDKCYPVTAQRRRVRSGKKQASEAMPPKAAGGPNGDAKGETDILSQHEGAGRAPEEEAAGPIPARKTMAPEEEVAGTQGWEAKKKVPTEMAVYPSEASEVDREEEGPGAWVPQLLRRLWLGWFPPDTDTGKTQKHE
uniref:Uncharacterized protein n=1 Tax=Suricata suricatta TaxID=37032 RepID=A0A673UYZ2_SURSU